LAVSKRLALIFEYAAAELHVGGKNKKPVIADGFCERGKVWWGHEQGMLL
jgi:hypothetical protein